LALVAHAPRGFPRAGLFISARSDPNAAQKKAATKDRRRRNQLVNV
jgi:hypothetical protein